jgi:hypothetical protein
MNEHARWKIFWRGRRLNQPALDPIVGLFQVDENIFERVIVNLDQLDFWERFGQRRVVALKRGWSGHVRCLERFEDRQNADNVV